MANVSRKSLRRFLKLWLSIQQPASCFHQTLTFSKPELDYDQAKKRLNKLLDNLHHRFDMASLYVAGRHRSGAHHFHVIFLFFSPVSEATERSFAAAVWGAWSALQVGKAVRQANRFVPYDARFAERTATIGYFTRDVPVMEDRWWGVRNHSLIREHARAVYGDEIRRAIISLFGRTRPPRRSGIVEPPLPPKFTPRRLRSLREYVEADGKWDWESFKRREIGSKEKVSDRSFLDRLNKDGTRRSFL